MDPAATPLQAEPPPAEPRLTARAVVPSVLATLGLFVAAALLGRIGAPAAAGSATATALLVAVYVLFRQIPFDLGGATTTAAQAILVPLWFSVEPATLPVVVLAAEFVSRAVELSRTRDDDGPAHQRVLHLLGAAATAWPVVGPAVVFAVVEPGAATFADAPVYLLALGMQLVIEAVVRLHAPSARGASAVSLALPFHMRLRQLRPVVLLDAALAPVGVLVAIGMAGSPLLLLTVAPIGVLLGQFAKERDERMVKATELSHAYRGTAQLMGDVLEADDAYTGGEHTEGVVDLSLGVGRQLGLADNAMRNLEFGALLHDVGKLRVPNEIINKPGKLNDEEWAIVKQHPGYGQEMLDRVGGALSEAAPIVRAHHERWDGEGYPDKLAGDAIPIEARIITACDSFSAMTTNRSYRRAMTHFEAVEELERCSGTQFDPAVVAALRAVVAAEITPDAGSPLSSVELLAAQRPIADGLASVHERDDASSAEAA